MVNSPPRPPTLPSIPPERRPLSRRAAGIALLVAATAIVLGYRWLAGRDTLFAPHFGQDPALVTNEFATYNPRAAGAHRSKNWIVTSGSLFERDGAGWTGAPDGRKPDADSTNGTGSSVFRVVSRGSGFDNVSIRMRLRVDRMLGGLRTGQNWDGVHLFARYQSPVRLYVVSVARRDGSVVAKKKVPGNNANGGTYFQLGPTVRFGFRSPSGTTCAWTSRMSMVASASCCTSTSNSRWTSWIAVDTDLPSRVRAGSVCAATTASSTSTRSRCGHCDPERWSSV